MRAIVESAPLCFAATVTRDGRPNLSPKGTIRVWDERHVRFLDIASPRTRANLAANPWIELNVVDERSRRGYRRLGTATLHRDDALEQAACARSFAEEGTSYPVECVVPVRVERVEALTSPGYAHVPTERATAEERAAILAAGIVAHVGIVEDGWPVVIPMAYHFDAARPDRLFVHGGRSSRLVNYAATGAPLCVEVPIVIGIVHAPRAHLDATRLVEITIESGQAKTRAG